MVGNLSFVSIYLYSLGITCSNSMLRPISIVRVWSHSNMLFVQLLIDRTSIHLNEGFSFFIFKSFDIFLYKFCFIKVREKVGKARGRFVSMRMQMICWKMYSLSKLIKTWSQSLISHCPKSHTYIYLHATRRPQNNNNMYFIFFFTF